MCKLPVFINKTFGDFANLESFTATRVESFCKKRDSSRVITISFLTKNRDSSHRLCL